MPTPMCPGPERTYLYIRHHSYLIMRTSLPLLGALICMMWPPTSLHAQVHVRTYIVVPADLSYSQQEVDSVHRAMHDIQAWFQFRTCGTTFALPEPFEVAIYHCQEPRSYYDGNWWDSLLPEMIANGVPVWQPGNILALWIKGVSGAGIGLGAHWCSDACGVAMASVEGWPAFNPGTYCDACPGNSDPSGSVWPCVPRGTMAHELGHAFGLPHSDHESYNGANNGQFHHSLMQQHWHFPYWHATGSASDPWGLLTTEVQRLWNNTALSMQVQLAPVYLQAPLVNLPVTGAVPEASFIATPEDEGMRLVSTGLGATRYYWMLGQEAVSTEWSPLIAHPAGALEVQLIVANEQGMMARAAGVVEGSVGVGVRSAPSTRIMPNPATDHLVIICDQRPGDRWAIRDLHGALIQVPHTRHTDRVTVDVSHLAQGLYTVEVIGEQVRETHRVLVLR